MRIFCLCNNWLGWQVLQWLVQQGESIVGLAVHPEARAKFGEEIRSAVSPSDCLVLDGSRLQEPAVLRQVQELKADMAISVLFGYVLRTAFLELFPKACINLHPALLPYNRGTYPNVWSIVDGTPAGVTLHYVDEGMDTGDVIAQKQVLVKVTDTGATLYHRLEAEALDLFRASWPQVRAGTSRRTPQPPGIGTFHRLRDVEKIDAIDLGETYRAGDLLNVIRARTFPPYAGAYFRHNGSKVDVRLDLKERDEAAAPVKPGRMAIANRAIGNCHPTYIIAELSANHHQDFNQAVKIIHAAKDAGADAVKLQTYTPDTLTIASDRPEFRISGTLWNGRTLHDLYAEAYTPWEWQPRLKLVAHDLGIDLFSTPFDATAVDFLEQMKVPAYKVASFELVDIPLIEKIAGTGKPMIISTGMATLEEIGEAVETARKAGATQIALLKCTSAYPAPAEDANLRTIPELARHFNLPVGLSDHTMGIAVPVAAVALGASVIEKHLTLSRSGPGPDSAFSLEPHEFKAMVEAVRTAEKAMGEVHFGLSGSETNSRIFRRSLFVVQDIKRGEVFSAANVRSIRPGYGLHPRHLREVLGRTAACDIARGTPLIWDVVEGRN